MSRISPLFEVCRFADAIVYQRPLEARMADRKKRVLVVDDARLVRLYYRDDPGGGRLRGGRGAERPRGAGEAARQPADLLIVDVNMPQMDGITFLRALRRQALPLAAMPALVTSTEAGRRTSPRRARPAPISIWSSRSGARLLRAYGDALRRAPMNEFLEQFLIEARELVEQATDDLLALERDPGRPRAARQRLPRLSHAEGRRRHRRLRRDGRALHAAEDVLSWFAGRAPVTAA